MISCLSVGAGGFIGAIFRHLISSIPIGHGDFPMLTLAVNILGALAIGLIVGLVDRSYVMGPNMILFLKVGICGGFTTFSTFALETGNLISSGKFSIGIFYIAASVILCVLAVFLGQGLVKSI